MDNLHMAFYKNMDVGNDGVWDVWQIEGPSMVWYFRGDPHVHYGRILENRRRCEEVDKVDSALARGAILLLNLYLALNLSFSQSYFLILILLMRPEATGL